MNTFILIHTKNILQAQLSRTDKTKTHHTDNIHTVLYAFIRIFIVSLRDHIQQLDNITLHLYHIS